MPIAPRTPHSSSKDKEKLFASKWYVIQVEPGAELEFARLIQGQFKAAGLTKPELIPSPQIDPTLPSSEPLLRNKPIISMPIASENHRLGTVTTVFRLRICNSNM